MGTPSPWPHFTMEELTCPCGCERMEMKDSYMQRLVGMRKIAGFGFMIVSGYRCPKYNSTVSNTGMTGPHTTGRATDTKIWRRSSFRIVQLSIAAGMTGIGVYQHGNYAERFIHLDDLENDVSINRPRPTIWTYPK